jgi:HlyD family secretion protein
VGDPQDLEIEIDLLSRDAARVKPGTRIMLTDWGGDHPLEARARVVEPSGFTKISALGVEEQRVNIIADPLDPPEKRRGLGDAFRVEAHVIVWDEADVLRVPAAALFRQGQEWSVYKIAGDRAVLQRVDIGQHNATDAQVIGGLSAGDRVVLYPADRIRAGVGIRERR